MRAHFALLILLGVSLIAPSRTWAESISELTDEFNSIETSISGMKAQYLTGALLERQYRFTSRLTDGQSFFLAKDYDRAAMVLLDLVEDKQNQRHRATPIQELHLELLWQLRKKIRLRERWSVVVAIEAMKFSLKVPY